MKRVSLAATLALMLGLAAFAGSAVAGDGHGWSGGSGEQQHSQPGQQQPQQPQQQQPQQQQPQQQPAPQQGGSDHHGWEHDSGRHHESGSPAQQPTQQAPAPQQSQPEAPSAGVKPSSTTSHWTHAKVGDHPDVSKRYGNGKTAAQIAQSHGASPDTVLTGPGNSQPHKTFDCKHGWNRSGGVDVHAIKSFDTSCTAQSQEQVQQPAHGALGQSVSVHHSCKSALSRPEEVMHLKPVETEVSVAVAAQPQPAPAAAQPAPAPVPATTTVAPASGVQAATTVAATASTPAPAPAAATSAAATVPAAASSPSGGVLGAQATLGSPAAKPAGGVLGTAGRVAGKTLPFTGLQLWIVVLVAAVLVAGGVALHRRGRTGEL